MGADPHIAAEARGRLQKKVNGFMSRIPAANKAEYRALLEAKIRPIDAGTNVGHIAAQSIGEFSTQTNLNSVTGETLVTIWRNGNLETCAIGELIDAALPPSQEQHQVAAVDTILYILAPNLRGELS